MFRTLFTAAASLALISAATSPAFAGACRDAKGKFVKCPDKRVAAKKCKDAKGRFAKCGTPGAKPA